jgi:hypothetical protein
MTDHDLATLLRDHVHRDEPAFGLSPDTVMALGRRTLNRRRARRGLAALVAATALVAVTVPMVDGPWHHTGDHPGTRTKVAPATTSALEHYDATKMPAIMDRRIRAALGSGLEGLGEGTFAAYDDQGAHLPVRYYDKASGMSLGFGLKGDRRVEVRLLHARSEAEGDARKMCAQDLSSGLDFSCTVTASTAGDPVTTTVRAVRPLKDFPGGGWGVITRAELRSGTASALSPDGPGPIDPTQVYFVRSVESVHSLTFLSSAEETVRAADLTTAEKRWRIPVADLQAVATDPHLVIPKPPLGPGGCAWTWKAKVTCSKG